MMNKVLDRFLRYVQYETTSDPKSGTHPSTRTQKIFANVLADELRELGLENVYVDDRAYVTATLPSNIHRKVPVVGFIAHLDTSPDYTAKEVNPRIIACYDGQDIMLNMQKNLVLSPKQFPELLHYVGQSIITTDGNTLLGADNKAGIAEIISAIDFLLNHPEIEHGEVKIGFTPDEEIGEGADYFDFERFNADFAYTVDGDEIGVLEYENFNAAYAKITIRGRMVHPGSAKNKMINSILIAQRFISMLPLAEVPEKTEGYEGFFHLMDFSGKVELTTLEMIVRDHDATLFEKRKEILKGIVSQLNLEYGSDRVFLELKDQYYNMLEKIKPVMFVVDHAKKAMLDCEIEPKVKAIRGGTDGARLSYMGLPCPNLFAGGMNFHGIFEFIPIRSMDKATEVIVKIIENISKESKIN